MDKSVMLPLEKIQECIALGQSFVLQGGAGSGKTDTLKKTVKFYLENYPDKKIICITHTNKAADEIVGRVGAEVEVSTIHSFISRLIKPYKRNLLKLLPELFCLPLFEELSIEHYNGDDKIRRTEEYKRFKAQHRSLAKKRSRILQEDTGQVTGKREYDKDPSAYNALLNNDIEQLNKAIREAIKQHHFNDVGYNDSRFDNFENATFGHDGLIKIASLLFSQYPNLGKIVRDKYDCVFIDEYQDTSENIIHSLIYSTPETGLTIGLFGDSEQAIYEGGIGSAKKFINDGKLTLIEKEDNFRCSPQVIDVANKFRSDNLIQKVALKEIDGIIETIEEREGSAVFCYSVKPPEPEKLALPKKGDTDEIKNHYLIAKDKYDQQLKEYEQDISRRLDDLVIFARADIGEHVLLKLPNKSVASDAGFGCLYELFDDRFSDARDRIKKNLDRLQFDQLTKLLQLFNSSKDDKRSYNKLIVLLKKQGFLIKTKQDKRGLHHILQELSTSNEPAYTVMSRAIETGLISLSESHKFYLKRKESELERINKDSKIIAFKKLQQSGCNSINQMCDYVKKNNHTDLTIEMIEKHYEQLSKDIKIERFYSGLFGDALSFSEVLAFYKYESDDSNFMTMHKTKGTGIENVIVVLDEFKWSKYDFASCFRSETSNPVRQALTRKLLYVACSRAKKNLRCVMLLDSDDDLVNIENYFDNIVHVDL
ncbi:ATP-dependent helicase [Providencia stuartii]|nr:ATP-dependent helicase [Providencia sp. 2023EL-00965]ELR5298632.1 ATP-dependent helicase [Providencia stuartii]MDW7587082.1 ATP-dependent helicase [Providencia sp. 2023EL-00965]